MYTPKMLCSCIIGRLVLCTYIPAVEAGEHVCVATLYILEIFWWDSNRFSCCSPKTN